MALLESHDFCTCNCCTATRITVALSTLTPATVTTAKSSKLNIRSLGFVLQVSGALPHCLVYSRLTWMMGMLSMQNIFLCAPFYLYGQVEQPFAKSTAVPYVDAACIKEHNAVGIA